MLCHLLTTARRSDPQRRTAVGVRGDPLSRARCCPLLTEGLLGELGCVFRFSPAARSEEWDARARTSMHKASKE